jgi:hypothetical protein
MSALPLRDAFIESRSLSLGSICHRALIKTHFSQSDQSQSALPEFPLASDTHGTSSRDPQRRYENFIDFCFRGSRNLSAYVERTRKKTSGLQFA